MGLLPEVLDLNSMLDGFWDGRRFLLETFCELACDVDNK